MQSQKNDAEATDSLTRNEWAITREYHIHIHYVWSRPERELKY